MTPPLLARVIVETSSLVFTDCDSFFISASLYLKRFLFWNALLCASFYSLLFTKSPLHHGTFREESRYNSETKNFEKKGRIQKRIQCAKNPPPHFPRPNPFFVFPIYRALTRVAFAFFAEQRALWWCIEFRSIENRRRRRRRRPFLAVRFALDD